MLLQFKVPAQTSAIITNGAHLTESAENIQVTTQMKPHFMRLGSMQGMSYPHQWYRFLHHDGDLLAHLASSKSAAEVPNLFLVLAQMALASTLRNRPGMCS